MRSLAFLKTWLTALAALATFCALVDTTMNPYLALNLPRVSGLNAHKPAVDQYERFMKAYDVDRAQRQTLILGASGVDWGMSASSSAWPVWSQPVYNLGIPNAGPEIDYLYLRHAMSESRPALVVIGLEFEHFLWYQDIANLEPQQDLDVKQLLANIEDSSAKGRQYFHDMMWATLSLDALSDGASTLISNLRGRSSDIRQGNWIYEPYASFVAKYGSLPLVTWEEIQLARRYTAKPTVDINLSTIKRIIDLCTSKGARVVVFVSPLHIYHLEMLDYYGYWSGFERWERELTKLIASSNQESNHDDVELFDFTGYDQYSTELVASGRNSLHWFWDSIHYKPALGELIIRRLLGDKNIPFGIQLTPENVDAHLSSIREQRRHYREEHQNELKPILDIYNLINSTQTTLVQGNGLR